MIPVDEVLFEKLHTHKHHELELVTYYGSDNLFLECIPCKEMLAELREQGGQSDPHPGS